MFPFAYSITDLREE
ncbi:uncharacterized protein FFC1_12452 [Fusarium fujikuroi]|nr:uncharacterized protein FFC1_12452 [Fusarium fujikuroi]